MARSVEKRGRRASPPSRLRRRIALLLAAASLVAVGSAAGLWVAIHRDPSLGPILADGARAALGPRAVAWAEDVAYGLQDRVDRIRYAGAAPKAYWASDAGVPAEVIPASVDDADPEPPPPPVDAPAFPPASFAPPHRGVALAGDGTWLPVADGVDPAAPPVMWKTLVHPDPHRSYAACAIVAIDLDATELHAVAGAGEPASAVVPKPPRPAIVDPADEPRLVAAFNGGWQAIHGHWGMRVGGVTLLPPRPTGCTVGLYQGGAVRIRSWPVLEPTEGEMVAYRQTPPCLVEQGDRHPRLAWEKATGWGAAVDGQTVIRRSAIGVDGTGRVLFYGMGDGLTASSIAYAMAFAGAKDAAQLDVNASFPRFLVYARAEGLGAVVREALVPGVAYKPGEYVREREHRDFFYVTRRAPAVDAGAPAPR